MKNHYIATALTGLLLILIPSGCSDEKAGTPKTGRVEVVINGGLQQAKAQRAQIVPVNGLPGQQLDVAIITVNYRTSDPENIQPDIDAWRGSTADITRGYFGGPGIGASPVTNGEIKYTNESGTAVQKVFYDETGEYYFLRVVYPYDNSEFIQTGNGAGMVFSGIDGSQDILCSNLGWGNMEQPEVKTNEATYGGVVIFSHMLSLFRIKIEPENETAATQYGQISNIRITDQPSSIKVDMIDLAIEAYSALDTDYSPVGFMPVSLTANPAPVVQDAGYIMAMPARKFTVEVETENRLWLSAELDFTTAEDPYATSTPGTIYDVDIKFMEAYEMQLSVTEADEWWMDSVFD